MLKKLPKWDTDDVRSLEPFSKIRLLAVDLDGTLMPYNSPEIYKTIRKLHKSLNRYEVKLTLATGRTLNGTLPLLAQLSLPEGTPIILYNGSVVVRNGKFETLLRKTMPVEILREVLKISRLYKVRILAYICDNVFGKIGPNEYVIGWSRSGYPEYEFNKMRVQWMTDDKTDGIPDPTAIVIDTTEDQSSVVPIEKLLRRMGISITRSGLNYIEVRPALSNKGKALEYITPVLKISKDEVLALGDSDNDAEMLAWAGISVAVTNASPLALQQSDYICKYDAAKGAVEALRLVRNARRYFFKHMKVNLAGKRYAIRK